MAFSKMEQVIEVHRVHDTLSRYQVIKMWDRIADIETITSVKWLSGLYRDIFGFESLSRNGDYLRKQIIRHMEQVRNEEQRNESASIQPAPEACKTEHRVDSSEPKTNVEPVIASRPIAKRCDSRLPAPGSILRRVYRGTNHEVVVRENGFEHNGKLYSSLSTLAKSITGSVWNGWTFFNLKHQSSSASIQSSDVGSEEA